MSEFVDEAIKNHKVTMFSKTGCPFCTKAKNVLKKYNPEDVYIIELESRSDGPKIQDYLAQKTGGRTVSFYKIILNCLFIKTS